MVISFGDPVGGQQGTEDQLVGVLDADLAALHLRGRIYRFAAELTIANGFF